MPHVGLLQGQPWVEERSNIIHDSQLKEKVELVLI